MDQDSNLKVPIKATVSKTSALLVTTLTSFITPFMGSSVNIALPSIGQEFNMDAILLSWVATSYILACTIFLLPFGRLADIYGRKRVYQWGVLLYIVTSFLSAISTSATMLLVSRVFQGVGAAMIFGTGVAILTSVFPLGERGKALGINVAAVYLGLSFGPFLGGFLTQQFGWRSIFLSIIPLGIVSLLFTHWKLKREWAEAKGEKVDVIGTVIYSLMVIAIMYGFSLLPGRWGILLALAGSLGSLGIHKMGELNNEPHLGYPSPGKQQSLCLLQSGRTDSLQCYICGRFSPEPLSSVCQGPEPSASGVHPGLPTRGHDPFLAFCGQTLRPHPTQDRCLSWNVFHRHRTFSSHLSYGKHRPVWDYPYLNPSWFWFRSLFIA